MNCAICDLPILPDPFSGWAEGNNAEPVVNGGRCCNICNDIHVIPARIALLFKPAEDKA